MRLRGEFFDYDPFTGITEYYEETGDGKIHIHSYQDVEPVLDHCKALANEGLPDKAWRKNEVAVYAVIPAVVQMDLMKKGINILDPNAVKQVFREVNTNYRYCKTTFKHHEVRS